MYIWVAPLDPGVTALYRNVATICRVPHLVSTATHSSWVSPLTSVGLDSRLGDDLLEIITRGRHVPVQCSPKRLAY